MTEAGKPKDLIADGGTLDLGARTARGGIVVLSAQIIQQLMRLGITAILARLLTPRDYGLLGMVMAFTIFLNIFSDLGLSYATIQKAELNYRQISTLFWVNIVFGLLLTAIAAASAPLVVRFFNEPQLLHVTFWISLGFFIGSLGAQHRALLTRSMSFGKLTISEIVALVAGGIAGVIMAFKGYGVYSLVGQSLIGELSRTVTIWLQARWIPGWPVRGSGVREMIKFGGYLTGFNFMNYFARNLDNILIGRFWGAAQLGIYSRAYSLMTYPISVISGPIGNVVVPALSKLQNDKTRFAQAHLRIMRLLALVSFPIGGALAVMADEVIAVIYGSQWSAAVPIFRVLCIAGIFQAWGNSMGWLYISSAKSREMFIWGMMACSVTIIGILPCIWFGGIGAAIGYTIVVILFIIPVGLWYVTRSVGIALNPLMKTAIGPLIATAFMCLVVILLKFTITNSMMLLPRLLILVPSAISALAIGLIVFARVAVVEADRNLRALLGSSL